MWLKPRGDELTEKLPKKVKITKEQLSDQVCKCGNPTAGELALWDKKAEFGIGYDEMLCMECMKAKINGEPMPERKGFYISPDEASELFYLIGALEDLPNVNDYFNKELRGRLQEFHSVH